MELSRIAPVLVCFLMSVTFSVSACKKHDPLVFVDPSVHVRSFDVKSVLGFKSSFSTNPRHSVSPDGKYLLGTVEGRGRVSVVALPLEDGIEPATLVSLPVAGEGPSPVVPLGWTSYGAAVYLAGGVQPFGEHEGEFGLGVYAQYFDEPPMEVGFVEATAFPKRYWFVPNSPAQFRDESPVVFLYMPHTLWKVELAEGRAEALITDLPSYDGLFSPMLSPDGHYFAYRLNEPGKSGIFILDTRTGVESALLPDGENMNFLPEWSPDGRWIAAYTAKRDSKSPGDLYGRFEDVDGPLPVGSCLTVTAPDGSPAQEIAVPGKLLSGFEWSSDGRTLSFQAGSVRPSDMVVPAVTWVQESLWVVPINEDVMWAPLAPEKIADLPQENPNWFAHLPVTFGNAVYYSPDGESILRGSPGVDPVAAIESAAFRPADRSWWPSAPAAEHLAVVWVWPKGGQTGQTQSLWVLGANGARKIADYTQTPEFDPLIAACREGLVVVYRRDRQYDPGGRFDVFRFEPEVLVPRYDESDPMAKIQAAVDSYVMIDGRHSNDIARCIEVDQDYYLVELKTSRDEHFYLYVDREGKQAKPAASHVYRPVFSKCEGGEVWFRCDFWADNYETFPFYEVTQPEPMKRREVPLFRTPSDASFEISHPGLAYNVSDLEISESGIFIFTDVTGPGKGGAMVGGGRPPQTFITESGQKVTFRFMETVLSESAKEQLLSFKGGAARVINVISQDEYTEIVIEVSGEYSFFLGAAESSLADHNPRSQYGSEAVSILFRPSPQGQFP